MTSVAHAAPHAKVESRPDRTSKSTGMAPGAAHRLVAILLCLHVAGAAGQSCSVMDASGAIDRSAPNFVFRLRAASNTFLDSVAITLSSEFTGSSVTNHSAVRSGPPQRPRPPPSLALPLALPLGQASSKRAAAGCAPRNRR